MITTGAISSKSNWNAVTTAAAQIHQLEPAHSISFNTSASNGNPSNTASKNPFRRSSIHVFTVVVLKPNRPSSLNCAYHANGKLTMLNAKPVAKRKPAIAKTDVPKAAANLPNAHGNAPPNRIAIRSAGIKQGDHISKSVLCKRVIRRTTIRGHVNYSAKRGRLFVRVRTHVTLIQSTQPQFSERAREDQNQSDDGKRWHRAILRCHSERNEAATTRTKVREVGLSISGGTTTRERWPRPATPLP